MAKILPLNGKYYGTKVEFTDAQDMEHEITIWTPDHYAGIFASEREIAGGWEPGDGHDHVEDVQSYTIAKLICKTLTEAGY